VEKTDEDACAFLLVLLSFYAEAVHASIHIFHFMMVTCIADSTQHSTLMNNWATPFYPNVSLKYEEVKKLLFADSGALTGGTFKANRVEVLKVCKEFFCIWGSCKTAKEFAEEFLFAGMIDNAKDGIPSIGVLKEFMKHADLIHDYATEVSGSFEKLRSGKDLEACNNNIKLFLSNCGPEVSKVDNLVTWIELMSITGLMHGNTLSFGRLILTQPVASKFTTDEKYASEVNFQLGTAGTMVGVNFERNVFSDLMYPKNTLVLGLRQILTKYAAISGNMKKAYFDKVSKDPKFCEYGWIWTDYCVDGIDGKSMTLTTYI